MFCPSCGTQIPDDSAFCLKCGRPMALAANASVSANNQTGEPLSPQKRGGRSTVRFAVVAAALILLISAIFYFKDRPLNAGTSKAIDSGKPESTGTKSPSAKPEPPPVKLSPGEIASKFANTVVVLDNYDDQGQRISQGSGFVCGPGVVLTNYHVVRGASRMVARSHDGLDHEVLYVAGFDPQRDVAALKVEGDDLPPVRLGDSADVKTGDHVTALGAPLGLESSLSDGIISAIRSAGSLRVFQTSAPISHGSSGGPLFDDYGNVIGLAVALIEGGENLNFAISIDAAKPLLKSNAQTTFAQLRAQTTMHRSILASSISLPPQVTTVDITVPPQGGVLAGSFSIAGGMGNDLGMSLIAPNGAAAWNGGIVRNFGNLNLRLIGGRYQLVLNNKMGPFWNSPKTLSGNIELNFYR